MANTFLVKMDHDCDGVSCVTYDDHYAEIARLQSRLQAMTENAQRLANDHKYIVKTWPDTGAALTSVAALAAHRKLMEGK